MNTFRKFEKCSFPKKWKVRAGFRERANFVIPPKNSTKMATSGAALGPVSNEVQTRQEYEIQNEPNPGFKKRNFASKLLRLQHHQYIPGGEPVTRSILQFSVGYGKRRSCRSRWRGIVSAFHCFNTRNILPQGWILKPMLKSSDKTVARIERGIDHSLCRCCLRISCRNHGSKFVGGGGVESKSGVPGVRINHE